MKKVDLPDRFIFTVTESDCSKAKGRTKDRCPAAVALNRIAGVERVEVLRTRTYLYMDDDTCIRCVNSPALKRAIEREDLINDFQARAYTLYAPTPAQKLGAQKMKGHATTTHRRGDGKVERPWLQKSRVKKVSLR